jgi:hypothetical protein
MLAIYQKILRSVLLEGGKTSYAGRIFYLANGECLKHRITASFYQVKKIHCLCTTT